MVRGRPGRMEGLGSLRAAERRGSSAERRTSRGSGEPGKVRTRGMVSRDSRILMYSGGYMCVWMSTTRAVGCFSVAMAR